MRINIPVTDELECYIDKVGYREHPVMRSCRKEAAKRGELAVMQMAPEQGAFLAMLIKMIGARHAIELGTFTGYSSLAIALALPSEGKLVTCDVSPDYVEVARRFWEEAGVLSRIEAVIGDASETLDRLLKKSSEGTFDFAFIDADKPKYPEYFEKIVRLVRVGGVIVIDDTLIYGRVATGPLETDRPHVRLAVEAVQKLNESLSTDERVETVLIPWRDGMTVIRKVSSCRDCLSI